jgi:hypothetical protein
VLADAFERERLPLAREEIAREALAVGLRDLVVHRLALLRARHGEPVQVLVEAPRLRKHVVRVEPADVRLVVVAVDGVGVARDPAGRARCPRPSPHSA